MKEITDYFRRSDSLYHSTLGRRDLCDIVARMEVGRGECHNTSNVTDKHGQARFVCSACGAWLDSRMLWNPEYPNSESPFVKDCKLNYCPNCGRKVVDA